MKKPGNLWCISKFCTINSLFLRKYRQIWFLWWHCQMCRLCQYSDTILSVDSVDIAKLQMNIFCRYSTVLHSFPVTVHGLHSQQNIVSVILTFYISHFTFTCVVFRLFLYKTFFMMINCIHDLHGTPFYLQQLKNSILSVDVTLHQNTTSYHVQFYTKQLYFQ